MLSAEGAFKLQSSSDDFSHLPILAPRCTTFCTYATDFICCTFIIMNSRDPGVNEPRSDKHVSSSGPALSIISSNIEGLSGAKQDLLADLCIQHRCDTLCLQETHCGPTRICPRIPDMTLIFERPLEVGICHRCWQSQLWSIFYFAPVLKIHAHSTILKP